MQFLSSRAMDQEGQVSKMPGDAVPPEGSGPCVQLAQGPT